MAELNTQTLSILDRINAVLLQSSEYTSSLDFASTIQTFNEESETGTLESNEVEQQIQTLENPVIGSNQYRERFLLQVVQEEEEETGLEKEDLTLSIEAVEQHPKNRFAFNGLPFESETTLFSEHQADSLSEKEQEIQSELTDLVHSANDACQQQMSEFSEQKRFSSVDTDAKQNCQITCQLEEPQLYFGQPATNSSETQETQSNHSSNPHFSEQSKLPNDELEEPDSLKKPTSQAEGESEDKHGSYDTEDVTHTSIKQSPVVADESEPTITPFACHQINEKQGESTAAASQEEQLCEQSLDEEKDFEITVTRAVKYLSPYVSQSARNLSGLQDSYMKLGKNKKAAAVSKLFFHPKQQQKYQPPKSGDITHQVSQQPKLNSSSEGSSPQVGGGFPSYHNNGVFSQISLHQDNNNASYDQNRSTQSTREDRFQRLNTLQAEKVREESAKYLRSQQRQEKKVFQPYLTKNIASSTPKVSRLSTHQTSFHESSAVQLYTAQGTDDTTRMTRNKYDNFSRFPLGAKIEKRPANNSRCGGSDRVTSSNDYYQRDNTLTKTIQSCIKGHQGVWINNDGENGTLVRTTASLTSSVTPAKSEMIPSSVRKMKSQEGARIVKIPQQIGEAPNMDFNDIKRITLNLAKETAASQARSSYGLRPTSLTAATATVQKYQRTLQTQSSFKIHPAATSAVVGYNSARFLESSRSKPHMQSCKLLKYEQSLTKMTEFNEERAMRLNTHATLFTEDS